MLFSGGDSPQNTSSILSGEGFDEVQLEGHRSLFLQYPTRLPRSVLLKRHLDSTDCSWERSAVAREMAILPCHCAHDYLHYTFPSSSSCQPRALAFHD
jgi:hypothetical protein